MLQGRSPLPYAISELIDNALRATQHNTTSRQIVITLALSGGSNPHTGLISVWDNGQPAAVASAHADEDVQTSSLVLFMVLVLQLLVSKYLQCMWEPQGLLMSLYICLAAE